MRAAATTAGPDGEQYLISKLTLERAYMAISKEVSSSLQDEFFGHDLREQAVLDSFAELLPGHKRFIDVGANIGQYTYFANKYLSDSEIIAIEANPSVCDILRDTIRRAETEEAHHNSFRVMNNIVSDREETLPFAART